MRRYLGRAQRSAKSDGIEPRIVQIDEREVGVERHDAFDDPTVDAHRDEIGRAAQGVVEQRIGRTVRRLAQPVGTQQGDHGCTAGSGGWRANR